MSLLHYHEITLCLFNISSLSLSIYICESITYFSRSCCVGYFPGNSPRSSCLGQAHSNVSVSPEHSHQSLNHFNIFFHFKKKKSVFLVFFLLLFCFLFYFVLFLFLFLFLQNCHQCHNAVCSSITYNFMGNIWSYLA